MSPATTIALAVLAAYVIGSVPFGFITGKLRGIDIREHGSGNIGATNVLRTLGKPLGITVFVLDVLKGFVPVMAAFYLFRTPDGESPIIAMLLCAVAAICGHNFPVWLKFKGGKGIATSAGALVALFPIPLAIALVIWMLVFFISKYVSLASIVAAISIPITLAAMMFPDGWNAPVLAFASALAALAVWRHRANIGRLLNGTENRFERKPKNATQAKNDTEHGGGVE